MKIVLVSDTWEPDVNGVATTLKNLYDHLIAMGHDVFLIHTGMFENFQCPGYSDIRIAKHANYLRFVLKNLKFDSIHIVTEGPLGWAARRYCLDNAIAFTSAYHTKFPEYLKSKFGIPLWLSYRVLQKFHEHSSKILVTSQGMREELLDRGFKCVELVGLGVDTNTYNPKWRSSVPGRNEPVFINVGRVSKEKNLTEFYEADLPGRIVQVGDGPELDAYRAKYPHVEFVGAKSGVELATYYANADVFVFPSRTDTLGLVMLEAMASGIPIAAHDTVGSAQIVLNGVTGIISEDLKQACIAALKLNSGDCVEQAKKFDWGTTTRGFLKHQVYKYETND